MTRRYHAAGSVTLLGIFCIIFNLMLTKADIPPAQSNITKLSPAGSNTVIPSNGILSSTAATHLVNPLMQPTNSTPKCVCDGALVPRLSENGKVLEICPECKCQHEARNTTLIKDDASATAPPLPTGMANQELNSRANVLNRVGHQTDKWKRQVREQRRHIYDRRTMLN